MATNKTNKAFKDRLKVTKRGKVLQRKAGHNHFNAREGGESQLKRNRLQEFDVDKKTLSRYLPYDV